MRVTLIGAPGAGKSAVAQLVKDRWRDEVLTPLQEQHVKFSWWHDGHTVEVLDGFEKGAEVLGLEIGDGSNFRTSIAMHFEHIRQRNALGDSVPSIACGGGLERLGHGAAHLHRLTTGLSMATPETQAAIVQEQAAMPVMTMLMMDAWEADYAFYLPLATSNIITPTSTKAPFATAVELAIQDAMTSFGMQVQALQGDVEAKATEIIRTIVKLEPDRVNRLEAERGRSDAD